MGSVESQPQNPEFRNNLENFHQWTTTEVGHSILKWLMVLIETISRQVNDCGYSNPLKLIIYAFSRMFRSTLLVVLKAGIYGILGESPVFSRRKYHLIDVSSVSI